MYYQIVLLAQRGAESPVNVWLGKNPLVLGTIAIVLGLLVALTGVITLKTGVTRNKLGMEFRGTTAQVSGYLRILLGAIFCIFGVYKIVLG